MPWTSTWPTAANASVRWRPRRRSCGTRRRPRKGARKRGARERGAGAELPRRVVELVYQDVDPVLWGAAELSVRAQLAYLAERG